MNGMLCKHCTRDHETMLEALECDKEHNLKSSAMDNETRDRIIRKAIRSPKTPEIEK